MNQNTTAVNQTLWALTQEFLDKSHLQRALQCLMALRLPQNQFTYSPIQGACLDLAIGKVLINMLPKDLNGRVIQADDNEEFKKAKEYLGKAREVFQIQMESMLDPDIFEWKCHMIQADAMLDRSNLSILAQGLQQIGTADPKGLDERKQHWYKQFRQDFIQACWATPYSQEAFETALNATKGGRDLGLQLIVLIWQIHRQPLAEQVSSGIDAAQKLSSQLLEHTQDPADAEPRALRYYTLFVIIVSHIRKGHYIDAEKWAEALIHEQSKIILSPGKLQELSWQWFSTETMEAVVLALKSCIQFFRNTTSSETLIEEALTKLSSLSSQSTERDLVWRLQLDISDIKIQLFMLECRYREVVPILQNFNQESLTIPTSYIRLAQYAQAIAKDDATVEYLQRALSAIKGIESKELQVEYWVQLMYIATSPSVPPLYQVKHKDGRVELTSTFQKNSLSGPVLDFVNKLLQDKDKRKRAEALQNQAVKVMYIVGICRWMDAVNSLEDNISMVKEAVLLASDVVGCAHLTGQCVSLLGMLLIRRQQQTEGEEALNQALSIAQCTKNIPLLLDVLHSMHLSRAGFPDQQAAIVDKWKKKALSLRKRIYHATKAHESNPVLQWYSSEVPRT